MYLEVKDRDGHVKKYPLTATSIVTITEPSQSKDNSFTLDNVFQVNVVDAPQAGTPLTPEAQARSEGVEVNDGSTVNADTSAVGPSDPHPEESLDPILPAQPTVTGGWLNAPEGHVVSNDDDASHPAA